MLRALKAEALYNHYPGNSRTNFTYSQDPRLVYLSTPSWMGSRRPLWPSQHPHPPQLPPERPHSASLFSVPTQPPPFNLLTISASPPSHHPPIRYKTSRRVFFPTLTPALYFDDSFYFFSGFFPNSFFSKSFPFQSSQPPTIPQPSTCIQRYYLCSSKINESKGHIKFYCLSGSPYSSVLEGKRKWLVGENERQ